MKLHQNQQRDAVTFDTLPSIIFEIQERITQLETATATSTGMHQRRAIGPAEAASMMGLSKSRVYVLSSQGVLPSHKVGNRVRFFTDELEHYIRSGGRSKYPDTTSQESLKNKKAEAL